jgi:hypothetical protein
MKFRATQPTPLEPVPEEDRIHLPRKFMHTPNTVDNLARRIERQAVQFAKRLNFRPTLANVAVFKRNVIGVIRAPARAGLPVDESPAAAS